MYCKCGNLLEILKEDEYETIVTQCKRCINQNRTKIHNKGFEDGFKSGKQVGWTEGYSECMGDMNILRNFGDHYK